MSNPDSQYTMRSVVNKPFVKDVKSTSLYVSRAPVYLKFSNETYSANRLAVQACNLQLTGLPPLSESAHANKQNLEHPLHAPTLVKGVVFTNSEMMTANSVAIMSRQMF